MYPRFIEARVREALADTRVVLIAGPRQSGKTTLAEKLAGAGMPFLTLDDQTTLDTARADPVGFIRGLDRAIIDEVQRAPQLLLAIKRAVDTDKRPGRFLLTGSANLMTLPQVADSLAGRIEIADLLPLSQSELRKRPGNFLERVLAGRAPVVGTVAVGADLVGRVLAGGYPEAIGRDSPARRQKWFLDYIRAVIERDVHSVANIEYAHHMPRLLRVLAAHSAQLINYSGVGAPLGLGHVTTRKYTDILTQLFLVRTLQPWFTNELKRLVKTPKLHFLDSGLLAALMNLSVARLQADRTALGPLLETFVLAELLKLSSWHAERLEFFHFRDRHNNEVDIVMEDSSGHVVGIEVKASATVTTADFSGLRKLAEACGKRFRMGLILYDHDTLVPFGEQLFAAPISTLWR
ncbi:MAG: ATP-binding protein [Steroidobacteraceae bacterium]